MSWVLVSRLDLPLKEGIGVTTFMDDKNTHDDRMGSQGALADRKLAAAGLLLTQGGEPTFVPRDTSAPEWNYAALGGEKLRYAMRLARELAASLYPGAVILRSFGKQYPGEPLPRWQLGVYRSRLGEPLWRDLDRLRLEPAAAAVVSSELPARLVRLLAKELGLRARGFPVYEDFEAQLRASDTGAAKRMLPRFSRRLRRFVSDRPTLRALKTWPSALEPAGWVLPLDHDGERWVSERWRVLGDNGMTLMPGESPIGLRLPLQCLPEGTSRRALTVELKEGELVVFLPPFAEFRAFADMCRIVEGIAVRLDLPPMRLEGYAPPSDEDREWIAITADPGVLEVNLPPAENWPELDRVIRVVFRSAEAAGLRGYKYQVSGRKVSTGGGAHVLLGGPDLERNPLIECPALVSSFLRFLQNHPSLSYLFSGLFTGPSSQAPRVDEGAAGLPDELEMTLAALDLMPVPGDPVMMDAMLRNLLMDWNGNTHRAELNVDKFYNPYTPNGRSGLIEFRALEMVPTADMLLALHALLRALAACFAETPYRHPLIDWGGALHDRFALPWYLKRDLGEVLAYLGRQGFDFALADFEPHLEFRFPMIHQFGLGKVRWTLRQALEPWPVMGDHQGTGRIVDATTDRLELLAEGLSRRGEFAVSVNGKRLPWVSAGRGREIGAVRYRVIDNVWGLQPHVRCHVPLRFEVIDLTAGRVAYGFEYGLWSTEGDSDDGLPTSEAEAARRAASRVRKSRRRRLGRKVRLPEEAGSLTNGFTLDLRKR